MKMKRLILPITLLCSMTLLAACGGGSGESDTKAEASKKNADGIYEPTVTINIAKQQDENTGRYEDKDDISNNPMTRLGVEKKGIQIETTLLGGDAGNYSTKLRLALTGSEDLPDVFPVYDNQMISDMIESGRVKAIDDDIEKYMPERLKAIYDKYPETFYPVTHEGKTYGLAITPNLTEGQVMIIRQDWLDKLNLKAPTNLEEFAEVIKAFTENDPDGNGKKDTFGFTYGGDGIYNTGWTGEVATLFSANTGDKLPGRWAEEDGELVYGSIDEGNKETLALMADWHKDGYIFQEAAATGAWDAMTQFTEGKAGIFIGRPWCVGSVNDVTKNIEGAKVVAYPNIKQDNGEPTYQNAQINDGYFMFNEDFSNMEAFFDYYDWIYDYAFGEGDFQYGFLENYDYDIVDDNIVFDPTKFDPVKSSENNFMPGKALLSKNSPSIDEAGKSYYDVVNGKEPESGAELRAENELNTIPEQAKGYAISYENKDELLPSIFNGAPTETMKRNWEQLQTLEKQTYTNIIYGKADIDEFDKFVEQWKEQGGDKITEEVNAWYEEVSK